VSWWLPSAFFSPESSAIGSSKSLFSAREEASGVPYLVDGAVGEGSPSGFLTRILDMGPNFPEFLEDSLGTHIMKGGPGPLRIKRKTSKELIFRE